MCLITTGHARRSLDTVHTHHSLVWTLRGRSRRRHRADWPSRSSGGCLRRRARTSAGLRRLAGGQRLQPVANLECADDIHDADDDQPPAGDQGQDLDRIERVDDQHTATDNDDHAGEHLPDAKRLFQVTALSSSHRGHEQCRSETTAVDGWSSIKFAAFLSPEDNDPPQLGWLTTSPH
jgi:hypothetical protein